MGGIELEDALREMWERILLELEGKLNRPSFETWVKIIKPVSLKEDTLYLSVPNDFTKKWVETRYTPALKEAMAKTLHRDYAIHFVLAPQSLPADELSLVQREEEILPRYGQASPHRLSSTWLNPKYTFESFVIGDSNRFAHAASLAVAEAPAKAYNPLFIYGGVGLGKTHLMHAIGHFCLQNAFNTNVVYTSSETFTNEFINSIRDNRTMDFRNKYRNVDILLIDDIQFLAGKEQTQEEFFHTFNALHESNRQVIISSDRAPKEIPTLEERLRSRFEWGLITDIQPPDYETRVAILRKKARNENLHIPNEVLLFIADQVNTNIRELEGAFIRVIAYASLSEKTICLELAREALKDLIYSKDRDPVISVKLIQQVTADYFNISPSDITGKKRTKSFALPRQIAMYLARQMTDESLPYIGDQFGGKDHTTILHGCKKIQRDIEQDYNLKKAVDNIQKMIKKK
jgi:chromosomal replication initiator protein